MTDDLSKNLAGMKVTRLWLSANLDAADRDAFARACSDIRTVRAGINLLHQDEPTSALHILLDGWAARYKIMGNGSRSILTLAVPGDICDLDALRFNQLDYSVAMLSAGVVAVLPRQRADALFATNPAIAGAFWSLALAENTIMTERAASIARRPASQRVAHLLCELLVRLTIVGKADGFDYDMPLTQEHIADTLGLTPVHISRTLHFLRSADLVTVQHRRVTIDDWDALSGMCGFRSDYLHLETVDDAFRLELPASGARAKGQLARSAKQLGSPPLTSAPSAP